MTLKHVLYLVVSLLLTAGIALAQQTSPTTPETPGEPFRNFTLLVDGGGFLGVYAEDINKENVSRYGLGEARGVGVTEVIKDSPAEKAGLKKGDVIVRFENEAVTSVRKLNRLVSEVAPDHTVALSVSRGGVETPLSVRIGSRQNYWSSSMPELQGLQKLEGLEGMLNGPNPWKWEMPESGKDGFVYAFGNNRRIGVSTTALTKQLADFFGVADGKGLLVPAVEPDSPAAKAGLKAGDVITSFNGERVRSLGDLRQKLASQNDAKTAKIGVLRNKSEVTLSVELPARTPKALRRLTQRTNI